MIPSQQSVYLTAIINVIIQKYLQTTTICILWHRDWDFTLVSDSDSQTIINIQRYQLNVSLIYDVVNHGKTLRELEENGLKITNDLVRKLTASIEFSHCESFIAFQDEIPIFIEAFTNASLFSIWRSITNKYVFIYSPIMEPQWESKLFDHQFLKDQPNILLVESTSIDDHFNLKTNKYVGVDGHQIIYLLDKYNAKNNTFEIGADLFPDKIKDLQGREVILSVFDYRPDVVLDYEAIVKNSQDVSNSDPVAGSLLIDGTEVRVMMSFCEIYNCTLLVNAAEDDWGTIYANLTGDGALGQVLNGKADVAMGAMYPWQDAYRYLSMTTYVGRSGITCLVPAPKRLASWLLPLEPFEGLLWAAVFGYLTIEIIALLFMRHYQQSLLLSYHASSTGWWQSVCYGCRTTFMLFISQSDGRQRQARSFSLRVLLFACFLNDIIITSIYGGGLASILTVPSFEESADSLERLIAHRLHWAANSEAWASAIRGSDDERMNTILENFHIMSDDELMSYFQTAYMGFAVERLPFGHYAIGDYITENALRRFKIMKDDLYFQYTMSFVPRLWPLMARYDQLIYIWHSSGHDKYWEWRNSEDYLNTRIQKEVDASMYFTQENENRGPTRLGMANFAGILAIWIIGIVCAVFMFVMELLWARHMATRHISV